MTWRGTVNHHQAELLRLEGLKSQILAAQLHHLSILDQAQVATADGSRSMSEWTAATLDIAPETAKSLVRVMRRIADRPDLETVLATGDISFDRVEALSRIPVEVGALDHLDIAGVRREAAKRARVAADAGNRTADDRFLILQPSLDESWWKLWGGLDGSAGAIVDKVLTDMADQLPSFPDGSRGDTAWRRATALVELAVNDDPPPAQVTVFVESRHAAPSGGEAGVTLEAGPRLGRDALVAILCDAYAEVTAHAVDGTPMTYGRRSRTIPPALRRAIINRDGNGCAADGCPSRHRLQVHHILPWSRGGPTDPENLLTLCWFHHHVVVHERGFEIYRHPRHGRIRFRPPGTGPPRRI